MGEYVPSPDLMVLKNENGFLLTKHMHHEDYTIWEGDKVRAQGGRFLMHQLFPEKDKTMTEETITAAAVAEPEIIVPKPKRTRKKKETPVETTPDPNAELEARIRAEVEARMRAEMAQAVTTEVTEPQPTPPPPQEAPAPAPPAVKAAPTLDQRIDQYIKLRDMIKEKDDAHKAGMQKYKDALEKLNGVILQHLLATGGDSIKTAHGTAYKSTKRSASLEDSDKFMEFVISHDAFELLDRKANVTAVEAFVEENGVLPPGVKLTSMQTVNVRRS